jgi:recombination protein RecT
MKPMQSLTQQTKKPFSVAIQSEGYKNLINNTLRDPKRAAGFVTAVTSAVSINADLQKCDPGTVLSSALLGESLNLSPSPQLGMYYMVPYKDNKAGITKATFQLGYKGYIQLAIRSGFYKKINVLSIKEGELIKYDPINDEIQIELIEDEDVRDATPTMGYYAGLEYLNGFRKVLYWSKQKMLNHADRYSKAFKKDTYLQLLEGMIDPNDYTVSSYWYKDFDGMAMKTMLRQLISKWGIMSTEMQTAYTYDEGTPIVKDGEFVSVDYVDNDGVEANAAAKMEMEQTIEAIPVQKETPAPQSVQQKPATAEPVRRGRPPKREETPIQQTIIPNNPVTEFGSLDSSYPEDDDPLL